MTIHYSENYSLLMAMLDFVPVFIFLFAGINLIRFFDQKTSKVNEVLISTGVAMVFIAGLYKGIWKLLAALAIADIYPLNNMFMPTQATGFIMLGLGVFLATIKGQKLLSALPLFFGTIYYIIGLTLGEALLSYGLCVIAKRRGNRKAMIIFVISFVVMMGMGAMAALEKRLPTVLFNWTEESINILGQLLLLVGVKQLKK